jgi:hypothetical protein
MAYALTKDRQPDDERIDLNEDHEIQYWTKELGISEAELLRLLSKHGTKAKDVRAALKPK